MVIESMVKQLKIPTRMIDFVLTPVNKNSWIVAFKEEVDIKELIGINLVFGDETVQIEDYNSIPQKFKLKFDTYKIVWLFHRQDLESIRNFILQLLNVKNDEIRIVKCYEEIYKDLDDLRESDDDGTLIKTGNIIFTISYKEDLIVNEIKGIQKYNGKRINIIKYGDSPKCHGCKEEGHLRKDCPHADTVCANCNKKGHPKCTYASRLSAGNYEGEEGAPPENAEDYEFENESANKNSEEKDVGANMSTSIKNIDSTASNADDLNDSHSRKNEADTSMPASQLNSISDIQHAVSNANGNILNEKTAVVLSNPNVNKRGAGDISLSPITSTSPKAQNGKMEIGGENEEINSQKEQNGVEKKKAGSKKSKKT